MQYTIRIHGNTIPNDTDAHKIFNQWFSNFTIEDTTITTEYQEYMEVTDYSQKDSHTGYSIDITCANYFEFTYDTDEKTHDKIWEYLISLDKSQKYTFGLIECKETNKWYNGSHYNFFDAYNSII